MTRISDIGKEQVVGYHMASSCRGTVEALVAALDARECETHRHSERVAHYARFLAETMGIDGDLLEEIYHGALLHDIGKIGIPDLILLKPDSLTAREWDIMKRHPEIGRQILLNVEFLRPAAEIVFAHEERFDGSGYPRGLRGDEIPLGARIFAVTDALDAMAFDRPYRKALPFHRIRNEILSGHSSQFDPSVVETLMDNFGAFEAWINEEDASHCTPVWKHPMIETPIDQPEE